jgi:hypothetical protein
MEKIFPDNFMNEIKIESGINIPPTHSKGASGWPWDKLEVGQSFFIPKESLPTSVIGYAGTYTRQLRPKKFASRKVEGGRRFWRIA